MKCPALAYQRGLVEACRVLATCQRRRRHPNRLEISAPNRKPLTEVDVAVETNLGEPIDSLASDSKI